MFRKELVTPLNVFVLVLTLAFIALLFVPRSDSQIVGGDTTYYYATTRTIVMDGDFDFSNDVDIYNQRLDNPITKRLVDEYVFAIGASLLWIPFLILGHWLALLVSALGAPINPDGYSMLEQAVVSFGGFVYGVAGWLILAKMFGKRVSPVLAEWGVIIVILSTSVIFYLIIQPLMSHSSEMFAIALFLYPLYVGDKSRKLVWLWIGAALGLITIVRWQYLPFALLILPELWKSLTSAENRNRIKTVAIQSLLSSLGFFAVAFIQMFYWYKTTGSWITIPNYSTHGEEFFNPLLSHWWAVLFSTGRGWFTWHPINLVGIVGLVWLSRRSEYLFPLMVIAAEVYICGSIANWLSPWSFGQRRLIGVIPFAALGFVYLLERFKEGRVARYIRGFAVLSVVWNFAFLAQYNLRLIPMEDALTWRQMFWDKLVLPLTVINKVIS